ncbi:MAG: MBL fold metallo-hydrolase [Nitrospinota bacterium]
MEIMGLEIERLGHDTIKVKGEQVVYVDPYVLPDDPEKADVVLITHDHFDHCDPDKVKQVSKEGTVVVGSSTSQAKLGGDFRAIRPGESQTIKGVKVEAVKAYNTSKYRDPERKEVFHPPSEENLGFVFTMGGVRLYHAGDTDYIPEMKELQNIDIALLPVSGTYVMTPEEAVAAAQTIHPKVAIPMHYGAIVASEEEARAFRDLLANAASDIRVEII